MLLNAIQGISAQPVHFHTQVRHTAPNNDTGRVLNAHEALNRTAGTGPGLKIQAPTFSQMVEGAVNRVHLKQLDANQEVRALMAGESDNLHGAMIKMEEAGVAFNLMMETRNKLVEAYQELMRLRV